MQRRNELLGTVSTILHTGHRGKVNIHGVGQVEAWVAVGVYAVMNYHVNQTNLQCGLTDLASFPGPRATFGCTKEYVLQATKSWEGGWE